MKENSWSKHVNNPNCWDIFINDVLKKIKADKTW